MINTGAINENKAENFEQECAVKKCKTKMRSLEFQIHFILISSKMKIII